MRLDNVINVVIKDLKSSKFIAECSCGGSFSLKDAIIFDGTKPFPKEALEIKKEALMTLRDTHKDENRPGNLFS